VNPGGDYSDYANQIFQAITVWAVKDALWGIHNLVQSFGDATEPDFTALVPTYNRVLAIALLILGAVLAYGIIEKILGGQLGIGLAAIPRVVACVFVAYSGLAIVRYATVNAALLGHTWDRELSVANHHAATTAASIDPATIHINVAGLILLALLLSFLAIVVYLELIVRSALILTITAFVPLVAILAIWPRLAGGALHTAEFLMGLLLSKFVVATAFFVGVSMMLPAILGLAPSNGKADWMASGCAVLLITAFSPVALFQGIRFAHGNAGNVARSWGGMAVSMVPLSSVARHASGLLQPLTAPARKRASTLLAAGLAGLKRGRRDAR
jgi:hypothetical protein